MRQVGRPKIFVNVNPRKMSSNNPISLTIDHSGKRIFEYHLKKPINN